LRSSFTIACRGSWLSLAQAELFIQKVRGVFPTLQLEIKIIETSGDREQSVPLHLVEGKDFFTREIQEALNNGEADFAVHSMKDVSSLDFFTAGQYAVIDRELLQDVAIFNPGITTKLQRGETITIGTSSPRRSNMATGFLRKALPQLSNIPVTVVAESIRGNVDTRLQKLHNNQYDGIILAAAGLNRLLRFPPAKEKVSTLLQHKKLMLLPLFECPPAAGQGAIVAEASNENSDAIAVLNAVNNESLTEAIKRERVYAQRYGYGCSQQFGVFHLDTGSISFTYASGKTDAAGSFTEWDFDAVPEVNGKQLFSSTDHMKSFFSYQYSDVLEIDENAAAFFISSYKVVHSEKIRNQIENKRVWASGTKTWYDLAKKGIWVEGCADGLGFNFLSQVFKCPLTAIDTGRLQILTNNSSKAHWLKDGLNAAGTYELEGNLPEAIKKEIANADIIFWTSYQQYELCKQFLKAGVEHVCPSGKTAALLKEAGLNPVIFPTIKSFIDWRKKTAR
jgi:hydroxymethylbilane synthase